MRPADLEFSTVAALTYTAALYAAMFAIAAVSARWIRDPATTSHYAKYRSLEGLRGILAVGVFVHHSFAAYGFFTNGRWAWSQSAVFNHLGQTTVALFFMITGFLFTLKSRSPVIRWSDFYVARIARIGPLYFVIVAIVFAVVLMLSSGHLNESPASIASELFRWTIFVVFGRPDINAVPMTWTIIAGVNWSLKFEVLFYLFAVPALHFMGRRLPGKIAFGVSCSSFAAILSYRTFNNHAGESTLYLAHFLGGILIAYATDLRQFALIQRREFRYAATILACLLLFMPGDERWPATVISVVVFAAFVGGATIFGLLQTSACQWLGDISYGVYLIHGLTIWTALSSLQRITDFARWNVAAYFSLMVVVGSIAVVLASISYRYLERPVMNRARPISRSEGVLRPGPGKSAA